MSEKELNEQLRSKAVENGLCDQWQAEWKKDWDVDKMVRQFYRGIDFFLKTKFISNSFIVKNFDRAFLRKNGIIVDDAYSLVNPKMSIVCGDSKSTVRVNDYTVSVLYVTDSSDVTVIAKGHSMIIVHVLGNASVYARNEGNASITVLRHSTSCSVMAVSGVKVRDELDYLQ